MAEHNYRNAVCCDNCIWCWRARTLQDSPWICVEAGVPCPAPIAAIYAENAEGASRVLWEKRWR